MKKSILYYGLLMVTIFLGGCSKYLTTIPDNRTIVATVDQVTELITTAYPHRSYMPFAEAMSDNAEDKGNNLSTTGDVNGFSVNIQAFKYQDNTQNIGDDSPIGYFYDCYRAIAAANQALVYCRNADSANYTAQKGEALLCRAYAHFMLVTLFANAYDANTASTDPGIPYITTVETDVFAKYDRKTVQYDYDMIESDINTGIPLINEKIYSNAPKFHFNLQAAHALAARFYLFKKNYAQVVAHANAVFGSATVASLLRDQISYSSKQYYDLEAIYTQASEKSNLLLQETSSTYGGNLYGYKYGYGNNLFYSIINAANVTGGTYEQYYETYGASPNFFNIPKFYTNVFPLLNTEEVLFNRVEANIKLQNYTTVISDLNAWVSKNVTPTKTVTTTSITNYYRVSQDSALLQAALDMKRINYLEEGMRWLDILRLKIPVAHAANDGFSTVLVAGDKRRLLQLPAEAATAGVPLNPR